MTEKDAEQIAMMAAKEHGFDHVVRWSMDNPIIPEGAYYVKIILHGNGRIGAKIKASCNFNIKDFPSYRKDWKDLEGVIYIFENKEEESKPLFLN